MAETICHKLIETTKKHGDRTAIMFKTKDAWNEATWSDYKTMIASIAAGLQVMGVRKGDRVAILSNTRYEWAITDFAVLGLGGITVPIYASNSPDDISYILNDSEPRILFCESATVANRLRDLVKNVKSVEAIICYEGNSEGNSEGNFEGTLETSSDDAATNPQKNMTFTALQETGVAALKKSPTLYDLAVSSLDVSDLATIIYTSGTTGRPRGVVHSHVQIMSEVCDAFPLLGVTPKDRTLTFLPFAHVLGRIEIWGHALIGYTMAYAQSIERMSEDLLTIKPTIMVTVPRIFEKIHNAVTAQAEISPIRSRLFKWALNVGRNVSQHKVDKKAVPIELALQYQVARRLVFDKITERLGGNLRFAVCGGAPLAPAIAEFFHAAGLLILEGYGLTETLACITVNTPFDYRFGTIGKAIGDVKLKFADDGEILVQSKKVMCSYYKSPEATAAALENGWFHTGDIGEIGEDGFIKITDRKKDLIKTAGGKYVAPQRLEGLLKADPLISQVHIHGDQKKYVVALVTLNWPAVRRWAKENAIGGTDGATDLKTLAENPKLKELIRRAVANANAHLASYESIKNFAILPTEFTVESGELTPSLKIKRKVVETRYNDVIESLYSS
jgi:long-chain acyl-CoA synthetase